MKLDNKIFTDASELIAMNHDEHSHPNAKDLFACDAISNAMYRKYPDEYIKGWPEDEYKNLYALYFKPENKSMGWGWYSPVTTNIFGEYTAGGIDKQIQLARQLSLLFMAEIVAEEE